MLRDSGGAQNSQSYSKENSADPTCSPTEMSVPFVACQADRLASPDRSSHNFHFRNIIDQEKIIKKYTENSLHLSLGPPDSKGGDGGEGWEGEERESLRNENVCMPSQTALYNFNQCVASWSYLHSQAVL